MEFKIWLEDNQNIFFSSFWNDGTITVYIKNKRYVFQTDPVYHVKFKKLAKYKPFEVLNLINQQVQNGQAKLLEKPESKQSQQKTLF